MGYIGKQARFTQLVVSFPLNSRHIIQGVDLFGKADKLSLIIEGL
jgi:hypothetical protein